MEIKLKKENKMNTTAFFQYIISLVQLFRILCSTLNIYITPEMGIIYVNSSFIKYY